MGNADKADPDDTPRRPLRHQEKFDEAQKKVGPSPEPAPEP